MANQKPMSPAEWDAASGRIKRVFSRPTQKQYDAAMAEYERKLNMTKEEKQAERTKEAAMKARFMGLAALKGSEKQVALAEVLRNRLLSTLSEEEAETLLAANGASKAKFWIDNRDRSIGDILSDAKSDNPKPTSSADIKDRAADSKARVAKALAAKK